MKKRSPSYGQNGQLVRWWVLVHSGVKDDHITGSKYNMPAMVSKKH
jgi:hypothetical protein